MKFKEWADNKVFVLKGGEISGTNGADATLRSARLDDKGEYLPGRIGTGPMMGFLDPGTWVRNVNFKGVGPNMEKIYRLEASSNKGVNWVPYEVYEKPILQELGDNSPETP